MQMYKSPNYLYIGSKVYVYIDIWILLKYLFPSYLQQELNNTIIIIYVPNCFLLQRTFSTSPWWVPE